jgi:tetratricopeptide (TPR) repeat protein
MNRNAVLAFSMLFGSLWMTSGLQAADAALASKWVAYGQKLYAARQYDPAIKAFSTAARANSADPAAWKGLGTAFYAKKDYASALKYYKYSLQLNPHDAALAQFTQKLQAATASRGGATAGDPFTLAGRYYKARQYDYAISQYNAALTQNPNNAAAYQGLGNSYYAKRDKPNAVKAYQRALQLTPNNTGLRNFLAKYAPEAAAASGVQVASGPKDWGQPLWRSAVLPGWGQFYNGDSTKGWIIGGITDAALIGSVVTYMIGDGARKEYLGYPSGTAQEKFDASYGTWESMANINHIAFLTFFAAYSFGLVDAVLGAKPATHAVGYDPMDQPVQLGFTPAGGANMKVRLMEF